MVDDLPLNVGETITLETLLNSRGPVEGGAALRRLGSFLEQNEADRFERVALSLETTSSPFQDSLSNLVASELVKGTDLRTDLGQAGRVLSDLCPDEIGPMNLSLPDSPRPSVGGQGVVIDREDYFGENLCSGALRPLDDPFHAETLLLHCDDDGPGSLILMSTDDWLVTSTIDLPPETEGLSSGGGRVGGVSRTVVPADGLQAEREVFTVFAFSVSTDGLNLAYQIEYPGVVFHRGFGSNGSAGITAFEGESTASVSPARTVLLDAAGAEVWSRATQDSFIVQDDAAVANDGANLTVIELDSLRETTVGVVSGGIENLYTCHELYAVGLDGGIVVGRFGGPAATVADGSGITYGGGAAGLSPDGMIRIGRSSLFGTGPEGLLFEIEIDPSVISEVEYLEGRFIFTNTANEWFEVDHATGELSDFFSGFLPIGDVYRTWSIEETEPSTVLIARREVWEPACPTGE